MLEGGPSLKRLRLRCNTRRDPMARSNSAVRKREEGNDDRWEPFGLLGPRRSSSSRYLSPLRHHMPREDRRIHYSAGYSHCDWNTPRRYHLSTGDLDWAHSVEYSRDADDVHCDVEVTVRIAWTWMYLLEVLDR